MLPGSPAGRCPVQPRFHPDRQEKMVRGHPSTRYARREPERTVLYQLVKDHLATFVAEAAAGSEDGSGLPRYVEREFDRYLDCGLLCRGFARVRCDDCSDELLVAFSCKRRSICPSCTTRRMHDTAAHLVDRVLPEGVSYRRRGRDGPRLSARATPRTEPSVQRYRTRLPPRVLASKRSVGQGCWM